MSTVLEAREGVRRGAAARKAVRAAGRPRRVRPWQPERRPCGRRRRGRHVQPQRRDARNRLYKGGGGKEKFQATAAGEGSPVTVTRAPQTAREAGAEKAAAARAAAAPQALAGRAARAATIRRGDRWQGGACGGAARRRRRRRRERSRRRGRRRRVQQRRRRSAQRPLNAARDSMGKRWGRGQPGGGGELGRRRRLRGRQRRSRRVQLPYGAVSVGGGNAGRGATAAVAGDSCSGRGSHGWKGRSPQLWTAHPRGGPKISRSGPARE